MDDEYINGLVKEMHFKYYKYIKEPDNYEIHDINIEDIDENL